jgi:acyl-CoA reductase-like NAD-dependent aldehyde dehydrogenase
VLEFGELPGGDMAGGNFVRPAIVVDPKLTLRVVTEEQFGPVIPVIPFETEADAIRMANDTWAGLAGSVWTKDPETAYRVGSQMVCGYVWVNDHGATRLDLRAPFGGMKASGIGRESGLDAIRESSGFNLRARALDHFCRVKQDAFHLWVLLQYRCDQPTMAAADVDDRAKLGKIVERRDCFVCSSSHVAH